MHNWMANGVTTELGASPVIYQSCQCGAIRFAEHRKHAYWQFLVDGENCQESGSRELLQLIWDTIVIEDHELREAIGKSIGVN